MQRHPQHVAGIWAFFALTSAVGVVIADEDGTTLALNLAVTLGWTLLALRETRRYRAQRRQIEAEPS